MSGPWLGSGAKTLRSFFGSNAGQTVPRSAEMPRNLEATSAVDVSAETMLVKEWYMSQQILYGRNLGEAR